MCRLREQYLSRVRPLMRTLSMRGIASTTRRLGSILITARSAPISPNCFPGSSGFESARQCPMRSNGALGFLSQTLRMVMLVIAHVWESYRQRVWCACGVFLTVVQVAAVIAADPPDLQDYVVGPNDVLAITVVDQPQLTGKYIVRVDGTFTFPILGRLQAGGLSLQTVENDVRDRLAKGYVKDPQVGVSVDQYRSQQIFIIGEVRQPGSLQFTGSMRLIEALA